MHEVEAFGPVSSIFGYDTVDEAVDLVARGGGSLVTSVATHDPEFAVELTTRISAYNGRVLLLDRDDARSSTGHGSPMPHLVHGGPGRAGGGEELGGIRAVLHHMRRTAIQGSPDMLTALTGVWHAGAASQPGGEHPFRKSLAELKIGDQIVSSAREVTMEDIETFAAFTGDNFYAHMDEEAAAANPFFPGRVAHGYLLVSWAAGLFVDAAPGPVLANSGLENLKFVTPVSRGRLDPRRADGQADHPARDRRVRRGALGCGAAQPAGRAGRVLRRADAGGEGACGRIAARRQKRRSRDRRRFCRLALRAASAGRRRPPRARRRRGATRPPAPRGGTTPRSS